MGLGDTYTPWQIVQAMLRAGFPAAELRNGLAISTAESGRRSIKSRTDPNSWGPWQINLSPDAHGSRLTRDQANDLQESTNYAYSLWRAQGWRPWSVYTGGQYQAYLDIPIEPSPGQNQGDERAILARGPQAQALGLGGPSMPTMSLEQAKFIVRNGFMLFPKVSIPGYYEPPTFGLPGLTNSVDSLRTRAEAFISAATEAEIQQKADSILRQLSSSQRTMVTGVSAQTEGGLTAQYDQIERDEAEARRQASTRTAFGLQPTAAPAAPTPEEELTGIVPPPGRRTPGQIISQARSTGDWDSALEELLDMYDDVELLDPTGVDKAINYVLDQIEAKSGIGATNIPYGSTKAGFEASLAVQQGGLDEQRRANIEQEKQSIRAELARLQAGRASQELGARTQLAGSTLPPGTPFVPGYEPGGAASKLFGGYGAPFTPVVPGQVNVSLSPTEGENALMRALAAMGMGTSMGTPGAPTVTQAMPYSPQVAQELAAQAARGPRY